MDREGEKRGEARGEEINASACCQQELVCSPRRGDFGGLSDLSEVEPENGGGASAALVEPAEPEKQLDWGAVEPVLVQPEERCFSGSSFPIRFRCSELSHRSY